MNILDCTLRDGGYYNNWDFDEEVITKYLESLAMSKIDCVELGLRNFPKNGFLGAFAYTTESYLNTLDLPTGPIYAVMVDAKTILDSGITVEKAVSKLFAPASESKINLVRVAAHFSEVKRSGPIVKQLKKLGYIVGFNLMQAGGKPCSEITSVARQAKEWGVIDILYFADSLGNMNGKEIERIVKALKVEWEKDLGIHTHNNMGQGLDNTLTAMKAGVSWLDTTITGMGRGAGNTQTENLLAVLDRSGSKYNPKPIYELVIRYFESMQKNYGWGSSLLYFLGAQNEIHPTYIQNLLSNTHYDKDEIVGAIDYLSVLDGTTSYNGAVLETALSFSHVSKDVSGSDDVIGLFDGKDVLIIANGPSTKKYVKDIEHYIKRNKPVVISINIIESISQNLIDYYVVSHNSKYLSEASKYKGLHTPIILPKHRFSDSEINELGNVPLLDYGLIIEKNTLETKGTHAKIPYDLTAAYALTILLESNARKICSVGFEGYNMNDPRQQEMVHTFNLYSTLKSSVNILSLTPTSYAISQGSIYAPII